VVRPNADSLTESQLAAGRDHPQRVGRHHEPNHNRKPDSASGRTAEQASQFHAMQERRQL
jgi:hypothetical protein